MRLLNSTDLMAKKRQEEDILWKMLTAELGIAEVRELQDYLRGEGEHYDMGYGSLMVEPYDARGGNSKMFRVRHELHGEVTLSRSSLQSVLHDLHHSLIKLSGISGNRIRQDLN